MLDSLFNPKSITVIGASRSPDKVGYAVLKNLKEGGFGGRVFAINPNADSILGYECHANLKSTGHKIDMAIIVVPREKVLDALAESADAGTTVVVIITADFKEADEEGARLEQEITAFCAKHQIRMLGPNCLGLVNTANSMNASFAQQMPPQGGISIVSQSGALCSAMLDLAVGRGFGLAKLISIGNKTDLDEIDFLDYLKDDPETRVICCYLEAITEGPEFIKAAERAAAVKPVVILKSGVTSAGARAASSHTGSLAGEDMAYGAAFKRAGVIRAENFESLFDYASALAMQPLPKGRRVAIITNAGGPGIIAADAAENCGLDVHPITGEPLERLKAMLPKSAHAGNPIDILGAATPDRYRAAIRAVLEEDDIDSVLVILTPQAMSKPKETAKVIVEETTGRKPVVAAFMGGKDVRPARDEFVAAGLPEYATPDRAIRALKAMSSYAEWRELPPRVVTRFPVNRHRVERILRRHRLEQRPEVGEVGAKDILKAYDFQIPPGELARTADEAVTAAERIGYPVAMKIVSPDIVHKSDFGGVRLNLGDSEHVRDAFDLMMLRLRRRMPDAELTGVYVEKMAKSGREVILGMHRDPQFGPMLMFGLGGIFVEIMKDVSFYLAPITHEEAMEMLEGTRSFALLKGARGHAPVDLNAIAGGLQRISQLATDFPQILELDINPFIVSEVGVPPVVADARMTLELESEVRHA
jgi:acetyltransferase